MQIQVNDEATTSYLTGVGPAFQDLRQVASQLAGCMVLSGVSGGLEPSHHLLLSVARELLACARHDLESQVPPAGVRQYSQSLLDAATALSTAFPEAPDAGQSLEAAILHLEQATRLHPRAAYEARIQ